MTTTLEDLDHRENFIRSLEAAAAFLRCHPDVPVPPYQGHMQVDAESVAEVDEVAAKLDVNPKWNADRTQYVAARSFGNASKYGQERGVQLRVVYITAEWMDRYRAASTYDGVVTP